MDRDFVANGIDLEHDSSYFPCPWCRCNTLSYGHIYAAMWDILPRPWKDLSKDAAWRSTVWRDVDLWFKENGGALKLHLLFSIPGLSIFNLFADPMHVLDLGLNHFLLGSVLWLLCYSKRLHSNSEDTSRET